MAFACGGMLPGLVKPWLITVHVTKTADVKTGADLVKMVSKWIDKRGANCVTIAVAFDTYKDNHKKREIYQSYPLQDHSIS